MVTVGNNKCERIINDLTIIKLKWKYKWNRSVRSLLLFRVIRLLSSCCNICIGIKLKYSYHVVQSEHFYCACKDIPRLIRYRCNIQYLIPYAVAIYSHFNTILPALSTSISVAHTLQCFWKHHTFFSFVLVVLHYILWTRQTRTASKTERIND